MKRGWDKTLKKTNEKHKQKNSNNNEKQTINKYENIKMKITLNYGNKKSNKNTPVIESCDTHYYLKSTANLTRKVAKR